MLNSRRLCVALVAAAVVGAVPALLVPPAAPGQVQKVPPGFDDPYQPQPKQPEYKPGVKSSAIKLVENEEYQKTIDNALDAIAGGDYHDACDYLQAVLESKEDVFVRVETIDPKTGAKQSHTAVSSKRHANDLIAKLPPKGLETYELKFGAQAKSMLDQAKESGSREKLGEVAAKFGHTKAGAVANELLATTFMDRGEYVPAALAYMQLIGPDPAKANVSDLVLFKATLAFKRAGDNKKSATLWDVLLPRLKTNGGLLLANGQTVPIKQVQEALAQSNKVIASNPHDWPVIGGNLQHNAQAKGSQPMLDYVLWSRPIFRDKSEETGEEDPGIDAQRFFSPQGALDSHLKDPNAALIPGGFPVAANGILFYRTYAGLAAVYLHDVYDKAGKLEAKAGTIHFKTPQFDGALGAAYSDKDKKIALDMWINNIYEKSRLTNLLFENSTVGTLTTDNRNVYAVDDLAVPIPPKLLSQNLQEPARSLVYHNKLRAYDIGSGKIMWDLPGDPPKAEFKDSHFLCAPIAVGGKLYVLNEKNTGELRLLCLDPNTGKLLGAPQKLGTVRSDHLYFYDIVRRINAIHLAYAEGILVCPTNAGEIVGVDLLSQSLAWAYKYRDKPPNPQAFPGPNKQYDPNPYSAIALSYSNWKATPPVIVDGKVVFTAPDASAICCVNLRDGTELWAAPQHETDVYMAGVFLDKVIIVGKNSIRALKLSDGTPVGYPLQTGDMPSGQGVASNNVYYLPLRKGEICAIDIERWMVKAHNRTNKAGAQSPGNLVFYEGLVISQTPTHIVAYPQLAAKLAEAEQAYTKDPNLKNLLNRGELRLADGQTQKAVDDLIAVLGKDPPEEIVPRTKNRLYEALGDLLQADFPNNADKYLKDFKELTKVPANPAEQIQREAKYWRIVAHGREAQGNLVEAFLAYKEFGASPLFKDDGVPSLEDPLYKVPTHLWLRGRITAMFEKANAGQRAGLEKKIAEEWLAVVNKVNNLDTIRTFIGMFDVPFTVGREARLELANAIIKNKVKDAFLEAELNLQQLRVAVYRKDPQVGGKALEGLARLEVAKGTEDALRMAAAYYGEINKQFPKDVLHDGKTGAELFQKLAEDPRLRAFLETPAVNWSTTDLKFRELRGADAQGVLALKGFVFQPEGDLSPQM
ncbi:MAG TPA: hypothetical protein VE988_18480, partial [Gemmataceae bacterium]|nr:hypothetical protein [Gemmataceae bacterium]